MVEYIWEKRMGMGGIGVGASELIKQDIPSDERRWLELYTRCLNAKEATRQIYPELSDMQKISRAKYLGVKFRNYIEKIQNETKGVVTDGIINLAPMAIEVVGEIMNNRENAAKVRLDAADKVLGYTGFVNKEQKLTVVHEYRKLLEEIGLAETIDAEFSISEDGGGSDGAK